MPAFITDLQTQVCVYCRPPDGKLSNQSVRPPNCLQAINTVDRTSGQSTRLQVQHCLPILKSVLNTSTLSDKTSVYKSVYTEAFNTKTVTILRTNSVCRTSTTLSQAVRPQNIVHDTRPVTSETSKRMTGLQNKSARLPVQPSKQTASLRSRFETVCIKPCPESETLYILQDFQNSLWAFCTVCKTSES